MAVKRFLRVALARVGSHSTSTGKVSVTLADLQDMVAASRDPQSGRSVIKIGHLDPRFANPSHDGEPVYGQVENLAVDGDVLYGDLVNVPAALAEAMPSAYPNRSVEIAFNLRTRAGKVHRRVLAAVALLGAKRPAIKDLDDVLMAHASGPRVEDDYAGVVALSGLGDDNTPDLPPAVDPAVQPVPQSLVGGPMQISAALLERLGLAADADEAAVLAAVDALKGAAPAPPAPPPDPTLTLVPSVPADPAVPAAPRHAAAEPVVPAVAASEPLTPAQVASFAEMSTRLADLQARDDARSQAERAGRIEQVIVRFSADPIDGGRITPHTAPLWRKQLEADEAGTVALLSASPRLYSPQPIGSAVAPDAGDPDAAARLRAVATAKALGLRTYEQTGV